MKSLVLIAAIFLWGTRASAEPEPPPVSTLPVALGWNAEKQSHFPTSLAASPRGEIWVGTEDRGVWRYAPLLKTWTGFTTADGLGDDTVYAVVVDQLGRVWAGHLNHGVSVFNGEGWKNYTSVDGPLGDRVFAIATCPADGDVWIATECGLARYSLKKDDWDYFTQAAGLPSNQVQAIAFDPEGNIIVGTQCDGIAMARKSEEYRDWRVVRGPRRPLNASYGERLPSSLINSLFVEADRSIDVATPWGIGSTNDRGQSWFHIRGADWEANTRGLFNAPEPSEEQPEIKLMLEDWITAMGEKKGRIFAGTRRRGLEIRNAENGEPAGYGEWPSEVPCDWVRAILAGPEIPALVAVYDENTGGLKSLDAADAMKPVEKNEAEKSTPPFPATAKAPDAKSFQAMSGYLDKMKRVLQAGDGYFVGDDWRTQGDWVGRYGRSYARLFGVMSPNDREFSDNEKYGAEVSVGPHRAADAVGPYRYIEKPATDNPRVLYNPATGKRCEAEVNDGSWNTKTYPPEWEGPDLMVKVTVPEGPHRVSLYFHNDDAHTKQNKFRDYGVELWPKGEQPFYDEAAAPIAHARVTDFAGGVYKQFAVAGPAEFQIRVARTRSFCTKLQGIFIDPLNGSPGERRSLPDMGELRYGPPDLPDAVKPPEPAQSAVNLWGQLDAASLRTASAAIHQPFRILAYRAAASVPSATGYLPNWRWNLRLWTAKDREEFKTTMERAWRAYSATHPEAVKPEPEK